MYSLIPDSYPGGIVYVRVGDRNVAHLCGCPRGVYVRWYHLPYTDPDATQYADDHAGAERIVAEWMAALDIVPWDETGRPDAGA